MQLCRLTSASFHGSGQPLGVETRRTPANSRYDRNMSAQPMNARSWKPTLSLRPFVSEFAFRDERFDKGQKYTPLTARIDCFLQFYFKSRYRVVNVSSGAIHLAPRSVLVGPHTQRREDLLCAGHLRIFTIRFSAIGFRALFGIPARLIADYANHADSVLGASFRELEDRLASTTVEQMPVVADAFLSCQLGRRNMPPDGGVAGKLVRSLQISHGTVPIGQIGALHGLSVRQIERIFLEHVGLTPKVFGRLARLKRALALGEMETALDWAGIAAASGYFDQAHMIREFRTFNGATPVQFEAMKRRGRIYSHEKSNDVAFVQSHSRHETLA